MRQVGGTHYEEMPIQPWHLMQILLTKEEYIGFLKGNILKYAMRAGRKEGSDDKEKMFHYIDELRRVEGSDE